MKELRDVFVELDQAIVSENEIRCSLGGMEIKNPTIRVLGQMSLLLNDSVAARISLFSTQDVDAHVIGESFVTQTFKKLLEAKHLEFDFLSSEIWLPPDSTYITVYEGRNLKCEILDPISALTSKAVKAPEKNRLLIKSALEVYGEELARRITLHGGDLSIFQQAHKLRF
jgi:hypothetical protein